MIKHQKSYTIAEATKSIERYCAYQERCHKEVVQKLTQMRMIPIAIDTIVAELIQNNFLNEERFAKTYTRGKFRVKKWGKNRILKELRFRDISNYNIQSALKEIDEEDYLNTFHELAEKHWEVLREKQPIKRKKKLIDYLLYRGWETHLVYDKVNALAV